MTERSENCNKPGCSCQPTYECEMIWVTPGEYGQGVEIPCPYTAVATSEGFLVCFRCARQLQKEELPVKPGLPRNVDKVFDRPAHGHR